MIRCHKSSILEYIKNFIIKPEGSFLMTNNKRWYDQDPTVSLAVSILRNASMQNQLLTAEYIIQKGLEYDFPIEKVKSQKIDLLPRRWYDFEENVYYALECMRLSSIDVQKTLAIEIINYLCKLDN